MDRLMRLSLTVLLCLMLGLLAFLAWGKFNEHPVIENEVPKSSNSLPAADPITFGGRMVAENYPPSTSHEDLLLLEEACFGELVEPTVLRLCDDWIDGEEFKFGGRIRIPEAGVKDMIESRREYYDNIVSVAGEYQRFSKDPEKIRQKAEEYLRASAVTEANLPGALSSEELMLQLRKLIDQGAGDPYLVAKNLPELLGESAADHLRRCAADMKSLGYSPRWTVPILVDAVKAVGLRGTPGSEVYAADLADAFCNYLAAMPKEKEKQWQFWNNTRYWLPQLPVPPMLIVYEAMLKDRRIDKSLMHFVAGIVRTKLAWNDRSGGTADEVSDEQWQLFGRGARIASLHLRTAWLMDPDLPFAAAQLITLAMAGQDAWTPRQWFELSVRARFDYEPAYRAYTTSLLPKWGGSGRELIDFGRECVETNAFGSLVPERLFGILEEYSREQVGSWDDPEVLDLMQDSADHLLEWVNRPESQTVDRMALRQTRSWLTAYLIRHEDHSRAGRLLRSIDCSDDLAVVGRFHLNPELALSTCWALSGTDAEAILSINQRVESAFITPWSKEDSDQALAALRKARTSEPGASAYLLHLESALAAAVEFHSEPLRPTGLSFRDSPHAWHFVNGQGLVQQDGALKLHSPDAVELINLACIWQFPNPVLLTATIEPPAVPEKPKSRVANYPPMLIVIDKPHIVAPRPDVAAGVQQHTFVCPQQTGTLKIRLELSESSARLIVNDSLTIDEPVSNVVNVEERTYKGTIWFAANSGTIIRDVKIQRLEAK